jgi:hypothetical protein
MAWIGQVFQAVETKSDEQLLGRIAGGDKLAMRRIIYDKGKILWARVLFFG